jgi:predicted transcriptional regulator of viral defense system
VSKQYEELMQAINDLEDQIKEIRHIAKQAIPKNEWITTQEFAQLTGLKPKTVSNYAGKGRFNHVRKADNGRYLIHIKEIEKWKS